ncbi:hypothetical protein Adt_05783 [Abeliophyllum distichum]|uniref:Uncharacterized protein n=1 Tax=Abeliophyllum distichum TaxID=126358 RepID=A0ABD1V5C5_9LAMI
MTDVGVPEMRGSLDKRNAPVARALDEELRRSATKASMARSKIIAEELDDLRLSYDNLSSVTHRALGPDERADDLPERFVAIYEPVMQQGLRLSMHPFFRELSGSEGFLCFVSHAPPVKRVLQHKLPSMKRRAHRKRSRVPRRQGRRKEGCWETEEAPAQKRKALAATEGLMWDARKARRTEEGHRSSPSLDGEPEGAKNSASSASQNRRILIFERHEELPALVIEMLPAHPSIVATSVHRYWTPSWEKVVEEATVIERLQLAEVNLVRGLVLAKDIFSTFVSYDVENSKSKKLAKDLKVMDLEKAQLESDKRALQFKLDFVVSKEADMKAKYEIKLKAAKECLKQARDQRRAAEASQKRTEEAQKLAEEAQKCPKVGRGPNL